MAQEKNKDSTSIAKVAQNIGEIPLVSSGDLVIQHPLAPEGYRLELKGTDRPQILDVEGNIYLLLVQSDVQLYYQLIDKITGKRINVPNKLVTVPGEFKASDALNNCPSVIPTPREWLGYEGTYNLIKLYGNKIPKGAMRDYPKYARRDFMLDVGCKFFRIEFLCDYVRNMSYWHVFGPNIGLYGWENAACIVFL